MLPPRALNFAVEGPFAHLVGVWNDFDAKAYDARYLILKWIKVQKWASFRGNFDTFEDIMMVDIMVVIVFHTIFVSILTL